MRKFFGFLFVAVLISGAAAADKVYFPEIRKKAANVKPLSPEDFQLGKELMVEIRKLAEKVFCCHRRKHRISKKFKALVAFVFFDPAVLVGIR